MLRNEFLIQVGAPEPEFNTYNTARFLPSRLANLCHLMVHASIDMPDARSLWTFMIGRGDSNFNNP